MSNVLISRQYAPCLLFKDVKHRRIPNQRVDVSLPNKETLVIHSMVSLIACMQVGYVSSYVLQATDSDWEDDLENAHSGLVFMSKTL